MPTQFQIPNPEQYAVRPAAVATPEAVPRRELDERVLEYILDVMESEPPQAPQLQQPRGLTNWEAAAGALNPQTIPFFQQRAGQGAATANQQAQSAFEAQMAGRKEAMGLVGPVLQSQRTDIDLARIAETERHNRALEARAPRSRSRIVYDRSGNAYEQDLETDEVRPITLPGGGQAGKPYTEQTTDRIAKLNALRNMAVEASSAIKSLSGIPQMARSAGRMARGAERFITGGSDITGALAPDFEKSATALKLLSEELVRMKSGAQINESEYARLESLMPGPGEEQSIMEYKLGRFIAYLEELASTRSEMQGVGAPSAAAPDDDAAFLNRIRQRIGAP